MSYFLGKTYITGPIVWLDKNSFDLWNSEVFWDKIHEDEKEDSRHKFFTTKFGNKYTLYQDLYGEFEKDEDGFYTDEPNILDFLNFLGGISERSNKSNEMKSGENKQLQLNSFQEKIEEVNMEKL